MEKRDLLSERENMKILGRLAATAATIGLFATGAFAAPTVAESNNRELIEKLMKKIDQQEKRLASQEKKIDQLEGKKATALDRGQIEDVMKDILAETKAKPASPKWMKNLKFFGDLRFRYEYNRQFKNRSNYTGGKKDRNRARLRVRFGFRKTWMDDQLSVQFRLATSSEGDGPWGSGNGDPRSGNVTWGGLFSKKAVFVDQAFATYKPNWAKGLTIQAGKMPGRPGIRTATDVTLESDVTPEGIVFDYQMPGEIFRPYVTGGWFSVQENVSGFANSDGNNEFGTGKEKHDVSLLFASAGFSWLLDKEAGLDWFLGASLWHFSNYELAHAFPTGTAANGTPDMRMIEVTTALKFKMFKMPFKAWGTWVNNCTGASQNPLAPTGEDNAWGIGLKVGKNKKKGDLSVEYAYKYIGANSVSHLTQAVFGGPNRKGHSVFAKYNLQDRIELRLGLWSTQPIKFAPGKDENKFTTRVELLWKF